MAIIGNYCFSQPQKEAQEPQQSSSQNYDRYLSPVIPERKTMLGGQLAYYYNTVLGPLGATLGYTNKTKKLNLYLNLGFEF